MNSETIPKIFVWLIGLLIPKKEAEFFIADIEEIYLSYREEKGNIISSIWLIYQMIQTIIILIKDKFFWGSTMFKSYLKIALRNIGRHKTFSAINIAGFAISLSLCLFTIQFIFAIFDVDRFHEEKERIYRVNSLHSSYSNQISELATSPMPVAGELAELSCIEKTVRIKNGFSGDIKTGDEYLGVSGIYADQNFLNLFTFPLIHGNKNTALSEPNSIVLTEEIAAKLYPDKNPVGRRMSINNLGEFTITGVIEKFSKTSTHLQFEVLVSVETLQRLELNQLVTSSLNDWENYFDNYTFFLLSENASLDEVEIFLNSVTKKHYGPEEEFKGFIIQPLPEISPGRRLANSMGIITDYLFIFILSSIAIIILSIAAFNYTNLTIAKALSRAKEVGVRKVIGAKRHDLFIQFISEAVIISLIAFIFAALLQPVILNAINSFDGHLQSMFNLEDQAGIPLFAAFAGFAVLTGIVSGLFPALYLSRFNPAMVLKDISKSNNKRKLGFKKLLVVIQFTVSIVFIIFTVVGMQQLALTRNADLGFTYNGIINVDLQGVEINKFKAEVENFSGINKIASSQYIPGTGIGYFDLFIDDQNQMFQINSLIADEFFIPLMKIDLVAGKNFTGGINEGTHNEIIVNEKIIGMLGLGNASEAIGKVINLERKKDLQIIGVVKDFVSINSSSPVSPMVIQYIPKYFMQAIIKFDPARKNEVLEYLKTKWSDLDPVHQLSYKFYEEQIEESLTDQNVIIKLTGFLTLLIMFISFFGLLGMVIFTTESRIKEIGIRKVLGARIKDIVFEISKGFVKILIISTIIAIPFSYLLSKAFISQMVQQIDISLFPFIVGIMSVLLFGALIIFPQVLRSALSNPVRSLRSE